MHWSKRIGIGMAATAVVGGTLTGGSVMRFSAAVAGDRDMAVQAREAAKQAKLAERAIKRGKRDEAVGRAERAVLLSPSDAAHRTLLGRAYLNSGRFVSAAQSLEAAMTLDANVPGAALNLSLAKIALGDWAGARQVLDAGAATIQPADRGLAIALAGEPMAAIEILATAAREPTANAKTRQNLALALALGGKWMEARSVAGVDLPKAQADKRMMDWMRFARPTHASDQVASLLGVTPVADGGMPVQLALRSRDGDVRIAQVQVPAPLTAYVAPTGEIAPAPEAVAVAEAEPVAPVPVVLAPQPVGPRVGNIVFARRQEIVQALPGSYAAPTRIARVDTARPAPRMAAGGSYYVQLGAYANAGVARDAWGRMSRRVGALAGQTPRGMSVSTDAGQFYRLSVGGFARGDAVSLCRSVRATGGNCFVRAHAGEAVARWARGPQVASR